MNHDDLKAIFQFQMEDCRDVLFTKSEEYASDTDRLHNFKVAAKLLDERPEQVLAGFMAKHSVSVFDMCNSNEAYSDKLWSEKITDHINYLILLRALTIEKREHTNPMLTFDHKETA